MNTPFLRAAVLLLCYSGWCSAEDRPQQPNARDEQHFVKKVLPLLQVKCLACHGNEPTKLKGGLDLRTRSGVVQGGASGQAAIVPGELEKSPLWLSVTRTSEHWSAMPPKENDKLDAKQLDTLKHWIKSGAPWPSEERIIELKQQAENSPSDGITWPTSGGLSDEWTQRRYKPDDLWAFRPLKPVAGQSIDEFLDRHLQKMKLPPAPPADRRTLIRRMTFDLTGLPPTEADIESFVKDSSSDQQATNRLIERLLASPHYGERMAQHWLDVTRYADSSGFANDYERGTAWRYRDYVIRSFNTDKPYDQFVREQIAGDELEPNNPEALIAVGFLRMGPWELTGMEVAKVARQRFLDDVTDAVGQTFLAQPLQCARCHDHKFDPIPTRDYYSIQAVFATTQLADRPAAFLLSENCSGFEEKHYLQQRRKHFTDELNRLKSTETQALAKWQQANTLQPGQKPPREKYLTPDQLGLERIARKELERLDWRLDRYEPIAMSVYSGHTPQIKSAYRPLRLPQDRLKGELEQSAILTGGDPFSPAGKVNPDILSAATPGLSGSIPNTVSGRRTAFAHWLVSPENPLTARVMVNRLWAWHFGTPLAGNPNNFGATGKKPAHPELLNWLANEFRAQNWSIKQMHKLILQSRAYQRSARHPEPQSLARLDPLRVSTAVFPGRRLSAEEIRDAMLMTSGELNRRIGGIPCRPEINLEVALQARQVMGTFAESWQPSPLPSDRHRRSIYILRLRGLRDPFFEVFDQPVPESSCEYRSSSTVATQAFTLFNSEATYRRALAQAAEIRPTSRDDRLVVQKLFRRTLGRQPNAREVDQSLAHWKAMRTRHGQLRFSKSVHRTEIVKEAVEENTGEKFRYREPLEFAKDFVPDREPADCDADVRALAELALVLFNTNEFLTVE